MAGYRIVTEALTNVTRHSSASSADVTLAVDESALVIGVHDDGSNLGGGWQPGVGLTSIQERAAELGGQCTIHTDRTGGRIDVRLPIPRIAGPVRVQACRTRHRRRRGHRMSLRIVVADDHTIVREGLRALLSTVDGYELVDTVGTGEEAVRAAVTRRPDVVVMDIQMPGIGGIEATRQIAKAAPDVAILMLTMFEDDESVFAAMRAGALGYVLKGASPDSMIRAIAAVAGGEAIFSPGVARRALTYLTAPAQPGPPVSAADAARAGRAGADCGWDVQHGHRCPLRPGHEHGQQPRLQHLRQAPGGDAGRSDRAGPRRRSLSQDDRHRR